MELSYLNRKHKPIIRERLYAAQNGLCAICLKSIKNPTMDHMHPRSKGGSHLFYNLQLACEKCNILKGNKLPGTFTFASLTKKTNKCKQKVKGIKKVKNNIFSPKSYDNGCVIRDWGEEI